MSATSSAATPKEGQTHGRLAAALQEVLTTVVRLRAGRQSVPDAAAFRSSVMQWLATAEQQALQMGYSTQDARLAIFAVVAFLDESVLNARIPTLAEWARRPLQDELFGGHMGGEWFFQHIDQLLSRPDSIELEELLEVYQLCLLLGFRGKFGTGDGGALHAISSRIADRLNRLRNYGDLAPYWTPPSDAVTARDPWLRPLATSTVAAVVILAVLWSAYALMLRSGTTSLRSLAPHADQSTQRTLKSAP